MLCGGGIAPECALCGGVHLTKSRTDVLCEKMRGCSPPPDAYCCHFPGGKPVLDFPLCSALPKYSKNRTVAFWYRPRPFIQSSQTKRSPFRDVEQIRFRNRAILEASKDALAECTSCLSICLWSFCHHRFVRFVRHGRGNFAPGWMFPIVFQRVVRSGKAPARPLKPKPRAFVGNSYRSCVRGRLTL